MERNLRGVLQQDGNGNINFISYMADQHRTLDKQFVYYDELKDEDRSLKAQRLYKNVMSAIKNYCGVYSNDNKEVNKAAITLITMGQIELEKEKEALNKIFGVNIDIDFSPDSKDNNFKISQELIDAFNKLLNFKGNYDRVKKRIKGRGGDKKTGQVNIASFFDGYFQSVWTKNSQRYFEEIKSEAAALNQPFTEVVDTLLEKKIEDAIVLTLKEMFASNTFNGIEDTNKDYQELIDLIDNNFGGSNANELVQKMYDIYGLGNMKNDIVDALKNKQKGATNKAIFNKKTYVSAISKGHYVKGGLSLEALENFMVGNLLSGNLSNSSGVSVKLQGNIAHTGATKMKADNVITFNINPQVIQDTINAIESKSTSRENITSEINNLNEKLKNISDGIIIYSSAKNYSVKTAEKGFEAGDWVSANTMSTILSDYSRYGALLQLINGAVLGEGTGHDKLREQVMDSVAEDAAYYLFDDFTTIGNTKGTEAMALHLFDLDGIYVPLSIILLRLGYAIQNVGKTPKNLLTYRFDMPDSILYGKINGYTHYKYSAVEWYHQRQVALNDFKIRMQFAKDFISLIKNM